MKKQVALITGSSRGIGLGIALELARRGFSVALHGKEDSEHLQKSLEQVLSLGVNACAVSGDLVDLESHQRILDEVESELGQLTTLVSNAGVGALRREDILSAQEDSFDHCLKANAKAPYFLMQAFANKILSYNRNPALAYSIVQISSVSAVAASTNRGDYCISKAAASMVAKLYSSRLAVEGIQVFDIQPGVIETDMTKHVLADYQKRIDNDEMTLIKRMGQPIDVARACVAAAAGDLPYSVGQVIRVDGGILLERL